MRRSAHNTPLCEVIDFVETVITDLSNDTLHDKLSCFTTHSNSATPALLPDRRAGFPHEAQGAFCVRREQFRINPLSNARPLNTAKICGLSWTLESQL